MSDNLLINCLSSFCSENSCCENIFAAVLQLKELDSIQRCTVLETVCNLLKDARYTTKIAEHFRPILLILLTSVIPIYDQNIHTLETLKLNHRRNCFILGKLIGSYPDVLGFALHYFEKLPAPFSSIEENGTVEMNEVDEPMLIDTITDCDIVSSSYNILKAKPHHFKRKWNWSEFYTFLTHSDNKVKWMAWNCIAIVLDMSESLRLKCVTSLIDSTIIDEFTMNLDKENTNFHSENILSEEASKEIDLLLEKIPSVISVSGVLLPILNNKMEKLKCSLVTVPSMKENLRSLALAVATGKCVCVQGTVGCGKTSIIEYIAKETGRSQSDFIRVQLGDQIDSKIMLGNYRCTEIPGEFIWLPGILTKAVTDGKWLLLEDIDSATMDVSSTLSNLLETGTLSVPGHRDLIQVNSGFQLFVTQRLFSTSAGLRKPVSNASNLLSRHWTCVNMEPLLRDELITIIETLFPKLRTVASKMVDVFLIFQSSEESDQELINISSRPRRLTSTRDLIKWCSRADVYYKYPTSEEEKQNLFEDAIDIFCCSTPDEGRRQSSVVAIGLKLGINKVNAENIFQTYKPSITCEKDFIVGRAKLPCKTVSYASVDKRKVTFSFTRPSACLLERIACCVAQKEPVLLVGETGTGKTSSIQYLAKSTGNTLIVINMNQLSESADLLGGYKPVDIKFLIRPIREEFELLFRSFFAIEPNKKYLEAIALCYKQEKWDSLLKSMTVSARSAITRLKDSFKAVKWEKLLLKIEKLSSQVKSNMALGFAFVEGSLVKAIQKGHWVLLDEINLANAETLEYLSGLLEGSSGSLSLLERGDEDLIKRHPDFTLFACMNPATDVGKKELPIGFRNRFTEFFVDELTSKIDLQILVDSYLKQMNLQCKHETIVNFYISLRKEAHLILFDGTMNKPHYSLRTLCRALSITAANPCEYELRSLYEAFCLSFLTQLDHKSYPIVENLIRKSMLEEKTAKRILSSPISRPKSDLEFINFEGYWITKGTEVPNTPENYILTSSVRRNLKDIARAVSIGKMPILLQGDTSVGKTSLITYLSKASGHVCVRINNHEHTDLQEYVGSYVADETGKLVFREGILVEAMRKGYWIILDELNLAPSDVLEALNRVLDDNRELFISETQQVVKAHNEFMLFATQNPPGLYGGRKVLSRAFRNRFVEFHFDEIPPIELQEIMQKRCSMPESYCKQIINVMKDLQIRRKTTAAFAGKKGFITLRDLFRWGERFRLAPDVKGLYDWSQHLADEGYLVLASKVRLPEEEAEIRQVIKKHLKRDVVPQDLFTLSKTTSPVTKHILEEILREDISEFKHIVWTYHLRRMAVLLKKSSQFHEPVLLVGETGCGKTTNCQLVAAIQKQQLHVVNCHMHTESSDFLGNLRPVRSQDREENQKLFEWVDGPLIHAMRNGDLFLADEISLADDSVLERLNSLLEPERTLVLAEKGIDLTNAHKTGSIIVAKENFLFVGTMNPGGDYGKKELSPALRNRFTEIWCDPCTERGDLKIIIEHNLREDVAKGNISECILNFLDWMKKGDTLKSFIVSTRDLLSWVDFINISTGDGLLSVVDAILQGACLTYIDGLGSGGSKQLDVFKDNALGYLQQELYSSLGIAPSVEKLTAVRDLKIATEDFFGIEPFFIPKGHDFSPNTERFTFSSSTTKLNTLKLLRAMQIKKPILLEGSPGVGKTSLVSAVARASGHSLFRINLSDQTDVCDLFGTDLPVEGGKGGEFSWRDGPFLRALRAGHWILLDELNLASQAVLESLNACFDHRGELFIPELGKTFNVTSGTKFFACQNPMKQGGARRGLPKSFLNRFTQVFVSTLTEEDLKFICYSQFPELSEELVRRMVDFNSRISSEAGILWGLSGSPWEMNLRDVIRWCEATISSAKTQCSERDLSYNPGCCVELIYADRMRTKIDKETVLKIYGEIFPDCPLSSSQPILHVTHDKLYFGDMVLTRSNSSHYEEDLLLLRDQMKTLRSLAQCINMKWMSIIVGGPASGKSSVVRVISQLAGQKLKTVVVNSAMDTNEILGGFEQTDYNRHLEELFERTENLLIDCLKITICESNIEVIKHYHESLENVRNILEETSKTGIELFLQKLDDLYRLVSMMKDLDRHLEELNEILQKLNNLSRIVQQEMCLNAGGKFEWVDSLLVKCLKEGHWLLVDQVNFCSPALLDRLNGLLEPNGVLTIGERGTTIDGTITTIKPHENFRLFLTMDPKYGEISRAMRNRGVEIFLLDQGKTVNQDLDVRSLLFSSGLTVKLHQDVLFEIHDKISQDISSTEALNITHLLKSAFLIKQQITRGFSLTSAFETSCQDVYIKARAISVQQTKSRLELFIQESCKLFSSVDMETNFTPNLETITWKVEDCLENSKLARIEQQGALLSYFTQNLITSSINSLRIPLVDIAEFLNLGNFENLKEMFIDEIFPYVLLEFFEKSSIDDVELRARWLLKKNATQNEILQNSQKLVKEVLSFEFSFPNYALPWDAALPRGLTNEAKEKNNQDSNRLALLLYWNNMDNELLLKQSAKKETVRRYSTEVTNGTMNTFCKDEPLIDNFSPFTNQVRKTIDITLREKSLPLTPQDYLKIRLNLHWYKRYYELGNLVLEIDKKRTKLINIDKISLLLKVHYKWLIKFLKMFSSLLSNHLLSESCKSEINSLFQMIDETNRDLFVMYNPILKIAKKFKAVMSLPLPYSDKQIADSFSHLMYVSRCLNFWTMIVDNEAKMFSNLLILLSPKGIEIRRQLLEDWYTFFKTNCFSGTEEHLLGIKDFCVKNNLKVENSGESTLECSLNPTEEAALSGNIQLWPLYEHMFLRFANRIQQEICAAAFGGAENCQSVEIVTQLWQKWSEVLSIPVNVLAVTNAALLFNQEPETVCRLIPTLSYLLKRFARGNYALNNFKKLSNWKGFSCQPTEDNTAFTPYSQVEQKTRSTPALLNLILELLLNKTQTKNDTSVLAMPSLGAHESRISQLKKLNILLWRNNASFNSKKFDCLLNDYEILKTQGKYFLELNKNLQLEDQWKLCDIEKNLLLEFEEILWELRSAPQRDRIFRQGKAWAKFGYLQTSLFTSLGYVDPLYKVERKLQYAEEDIKDLKCTFYVKILEGRIFGKKEIDNSRFKEIEPMVKNIIADREVLRTKRAYRPANSDFLILVKEFENFRNTLGSFSVVQNHLLELSKVFDDFAGKNPDIKRAENVVLRTETWQESLEQFIDRVENRFLSSYPDLILPAFAAISDMKHGINIMTTHIQGMISKSSNQDLEGLIEKMIVFPTINRRQSSLLDLVDFCTLDSTREVINKNLRVDNQFSSFREQFKITLSGLHELHNYILLNGKLSKKLWSKLSEIMHQVILIWKQQQKEILQQELDEESMYKSTRTHASQTVEEEEIKREIENLFPTYKETDFNDFGIDAQCQGTENGEVRTKIKERRSVLLSLEDIKEVNRVYSSILISSTCGSSDWLKESLRGTVSQKSPDYVNPLLLRCNTVGMLLDNVTVSLDSKISERLYSSLNYLTSATLSICQGKKLSGKNQETFDFYKDSNISEVSSCLGILRNILDKISLLLQEWPEHPTLRAIRVVIRRILEFPVTSSIARFLTGLELLLVKMKEWEENAHKGVSLFEHMANLTQQIVSWRKLELASWKDCLNVTFLRLRDQSAKWCFWLYTLLESYVNKIHPEDDCFEEVQEVTVPKEEQISPEKLVEVLHCFISKSSLVEFEARLQLLLTFHCHAFYFNSSPERDEVLAITWNIYNYYKQFIDEVNTKINGLRNPIEKKLKDFVKITRWNDISYWAVKETIAKSHKTLHKFVKEYEKGLKENVTACLVVKPTNNLNHKENLKKVDPDIFLLPSESFEKVEIDKEKLIPDQLVTSLKTKIAASRFEEIRTNLENLVEDYMERSANLKKIEIDNTLPKPKQISHAKSVLQQKKKALSDYFKTIAHLGVSYRIGILAWKNKQNTVIDLMIPPLDLNALRNFDSQADKLMLDQWRDCENYYQKSVAEFIALTQMLSNAHKDLNPLNVERFKGYSAHMLLMANEQKRTLTEEMKHFVAVRSQIYSLKSVNLQSNLPKQENLFTIAKKFKKLLITLQSSLDQLQLCFDACPTKTDIEENEIYDMEELPLTVLYTTKQDPLFGSVNSFFGDCSLRVRTMTLGFNSLFRSSVPILTTEHYEYLKKGNETLEGLRTKLTEIEKSFGGEVNLNHSLITSIVYVKEIIEDYLFHLVEFNQVGEETYEYDEDLLEFENTLTDLLRTAVTTLQIDEEEKEEICFEVEDQLEKNTITEMLIKSLRNKLTKLEIETVSKKLEKLINFHFGGFEKLRKFLPLLEQYLLFSEFYLTEQVASFRLTCKMLHLQLNVFLDLAINGFCIPKNLELDVDPNGEENSQENTGKGGMGLSNEEGDQDVSDRIESEDQLEEAKQKGQEEEKDEKSCPEEENGIDMSEDFESNLQNMEKGEEDNENSDEDDGDLDKEMDETNEGENQQDKELWGDDEETEENKENLKDDENAGKGEELDDETMGAKNNEETLPKESGEYKEKEDISDLNEPDINDDQIDPYHGNQQPEVEPEALDLPDDINLDEDDAMDQENKEEDVFDIDNMKEPTLPPDEEAKEDPNEEASEEPNEEGQEETKENSESNEEKEVESGDEEGENIEAAPIESETGPTEEGADEVPDEENSPEEQQTVLNVDDTDKRGDNAMQIDGTEGNENNPNQEPTEKDASKKENVQDSQNDYGTGKSNQGFGKTESAIDEGGASDERNTENTQKKRKTPKELKDENKTLLEENEPIVKKPKTDIQEKGNEKEISEKETIDETADKETRFRHVDSKESSNQCAVDAATTDQVKEQASKITMEEKEKEEEEGTEEQDVNMLCEDEPMQQEPTDQIHPEQFSTLEDKNKGKSSKAKNECEQMEIDSDSISQLVETEKVERGKDSAFFTNLENLSMENATKDYEHRRNEVKQVLAHWRTEPTTEEAINTWNAVSLITDTAARELAEKLRLVLEPTQASRLKGDYKTGKRINMRKIIPYIASQFRKDKIWLRRTKPSKRNYQIVLAIDDSSSMVDNDSKEIAFESLSLISKALTYLEAGQLGVISFGEDVNVLHPLGETFTQESGARLMQKMRFEQTKTKVPQLVDYSIDMFNMQNDSVENAKLLVILSDGRGIFSEGKNRMAYAVRRARLAGVFTVFVVIDNQKNKESILDIRMPIAKPGQPLVIQSYMEHFPFPFYMILRDINALPDILSDALRQWFELIGNMDN